MLNHMKSPMLKNYEPIKMAIHVVQPIHPCSYIQALIICIYSLINSQNLTNPQYSYFLSDVLSHMFPNVLAPIEIPTGINFHFFFSHMSSHIPIILSFTFSQQIMHTELQMLICCKSLTHTHYIIHSLILTHYGGTLDPEFYNA